MTTLATIDIERIARILGRLLPAGAPLHEPELGERERALVDECLESGWVSSAGAYVDRFENMLAAFTGAGAAIATVNGTAALHAALVLAGVEHDDEVIVPAMTFVATANAVAYVGAVPHFADSDEGTLGLDPARLEAHLADIAEITDDGCRNVSTGRRIAAVVAMHAFGHPVDLDPLAGVCERFRLTLVEDAAGAIGSRYKGRHVGNHGRIAILSFNGNKTITTGGGGAILTNDDGLAAAAKHLTTTAKLPHRWAFEHDRVGFNYRLPNINAAMGCAQMERLAGFIENKRRLAAIYAEALGDVGGTRIFAEPGFARSNYWLNVMLLDRDAARHRDEVLALTNDRGLMTRPAWTPMHELRMFRTCPRMELRVAEDIHRRLINLPSNPRLARAIDGEA